jgi:photosystem II stability/assembly factor-like uncharacterized protein
MCNTYAQSICFERSVFTNQIADDRFPMTMSFVNDTLGYAVFAIRDGGEHNNKMALVKTTDAGQSWQQLNIVSSPINSINEQTWVQINFVDKDNGFIFTQHGALQTTDGGGVWTTMSSMPNPKFITTDFSRQILGGIFTVSTTGWRFWNYNLSNKIGINTMFNGYLSLNAASIVNDSTMFVVGTDTIRRSGITPVTYNVRTIISKTSDTGRTWNEVYTETISTTAIATSLTSFASASYALFFSSTNEGVLLRGNSGRKTTDGFQTFSQIARPDGTLSYLGMQQTAKDSVLLMYSTPQGARIYKTSKDFDTYTALDLDSLPNNIKFHFFDDNKGIIHGVFQSGTSSRLPIMHTTSCDGLVFTLQPQSQTIDENCTLHLSVDFSQNTSFQWFRNGTAISGATNKNLIIENITTNQAGSYYCIATNLGTKIHSDTAIISVQSIVIDTQPQSQLMCMGSSTTLKVSTQNNVTYQWRFNETDMPNATDSVLIISDFDNVKIGRYSCLLTNPCGVTRMSNNADLSLHPLAIITTQPQDVKTCENNSISLNVVATNAVSYEWFKNDIAISNATNSQYEISNVSEADTGTYRCRVFGICGDYQDVSVRVSFHPELEIIDYSDTIAHCTIGNITHTYFVTANNAISYLWNTREAFGNLSDDTRRTFSGTVNSSRLPENLYCKVTGHCETIQMPFVFFAAPVAQISNLTSSTTICPEDTTAILEFKVTGNNTTGHYQWFINDVLVADSIGQSLTLANKFKKDIISCIGVGSTHHCTPTAKFSTSIKYHPFPDTNLIKRNSGDVFILGELNSNYFETLVYHLNDRDVWMSLGGSRQVFNNLRTTYTIENGWYYIERRNPQGCFFDQYRLLVLKQIGFAPRGQYVGNSEAISEITGYNLDFYVQAGISFHWIYSIDNGKNWTTVPSSQNALSIQPFTNQSHVLYSVRKHIDKQFVTNYAEVLIKNFEQEVSDTSWYLVNSLDMDLSSLVFVDENNGFIGSSKGLLRTTNSAKDFSVVSAHDNALSSSHVSHVFALSNSRIGFFSNRDNRAYLSTNNGQSWEQAIRLAGITDRINFSPINDYEVFFTDGYWGIGTVNFQNKTLNVCQLNTCIITSNIIHGAHQSDVAVPPNYSETKRGAIGVGSRGIDYQISNNTYQNLAAMCGNNYKRIRDESPLHRAKFRDNNTVFITGQNGLILRSDDGGKENTYYEVSTQTTQDLRDIQFLNDTLGFIVGNVGTLLKTTDGGNTWHLQHTGINENIVNFQMLCENSGYIITNNGKIYRKQTPKTVGNLTVIKNPFSVVACENDNATFTVEVAGATSFQWYKNNAVLQGKTQPTLSIVVTEATAGIYSCLATDNIDTIMTNSATLSIRQKPRITNLSENQEVFVGTSLNLQIESIGAEKFQWYKNDNPQIGNTQSNLNFPNIQHQDSGVYRCKISNACDTLWSETISIRVKDYETAFAYILESPQNTWVCENDIVGLSVRTINATAFQWYHNHTAIDGATEQSLLLSNISQNETGIYACKVYGEQNSVWSDTVFVLFHSEPIVLHEGDTVLNLTVGENLFLSFSFENSQSHRWFRNDTLLDEHAEPVIMQSNVQEIHQGRYKFEITGHCGTLASSPNILVKVSPIIVVEKIELLNKSDDTTVCLNSTLTLFVEAENAENYQWFRDGAIINNATTSQVNVQVTANAVYSCKMTNDDDTLTTYIAIDLLPNANIIDHSNNTISAVEETTIELFVKATNTKKYEWYFNNGFLGTHQSSEQSVLKLENLQTNQSGRYTCRIYDECVYQNVTIDLTVNPDQTSIQHKDLSKEIVLYPNPVNDVLFVDTDSPISKVEILNLSGAMLMNIKIENKHRLSANVEHLRAGTYFVKIYFDDKTIRIIKFVKN